MVNTNRIVNSNKSIYFNNDASTPLGQSYNCNYTVISTCSHSDSPQSSVFGESWFINVSDSIESCISSDSIQAKGFSTCQTTNAFNVALSETDVINHLCNCNDTKLDWCFIHQKAKSIDLETQGTEFGFIPASVIDIPLFRPPKTLDIDTLDQWAFEAHKLVKASGTYNYNYCRIKVPTELNINNWRLLCANYHDQKLLDYLEYGFPLCIDRDSFQYNSSGDNHPSATNFPMDVDAYFKKETEHKAIVGPCNHIPFPVHYSPLLSRPKPDDTRRVIVNMSYPYGASLNDRISNTHYDGVDFTLKYPSVEDIVNTVQDLGNDVLLSKIDISRAFRNLRVNPLEYDVLGLQWKGNAYLYISIPMGMKTVCLIISTTSSASTSVRTRVKNSTHCIHCLSF